MIKFIASCWDADMNNQYNPLRRLELASRHCFMQVLGWMWSVVFSLTFLSIFHFGLTWMAHLLLFGGAAITVAVLRENEKQGMVEARAACGFSDASRCVWKLDSEA